MSQRFGTTPDALTRMPRGQLRACITCPTCHETHRKSILMRRVRRHMEELKSPVRVTLHTRCPQCHCALVSRVRIPMNAADDVHTEIA